MNRTSNTLILCLILPLLGFTPARDGVCPSDNVKPKQELASSGSIRSGEIPIASALAFIKSESPSGSCNLTLSALPALKPEIYNNGTDDDGDGLVDCDDTVSPYCTGLTSAGTTTNPTICNGGNGSIQLSVSGGTAPYSFTWTNGLTSGSSNSSLLTGLSEGNYIIAIADSGICKDTITLSIYDPTGCNTNNCIGEAAQFAILGLEGGSIIINSATNIYGDIGYSANVTSIDNKKAGNDGPFTGTVYVHGSVAQFSYDAQNFLPSGGIVQNNTTHNARLNQANIDAVAKSTLFAGKTPNVILGALGDNDNKTVNRVGPTTVVQIASLNYNYDVLTLVGQAGQDDAFIINVLGDFLFSGSEIRLVNIRPEMVVFNFPNASTISLNKSANIFNGTILAPTSSVEYHNPASFNGAIIALNITVHSDFNIFHKSLEIYCGEICNNGIDDDEDGLVDCNDPECSTSNGIGGIKLGNLTEYLFFFADAGNDANWQGATKGFVGDVAVDGLQAYERTSGGVPYAGTIYTNDNSLNGWAGIVDQNDAPEVGPSQAFGVTGETARIAGLENDLANAFSQINGLATSPGYAGVSSSSLDGLNTENGATEVFVINITSDLSTSTKIDITGDASDVFVLRWDSDGNPNNGYQGLVKFQGGGGVVPHGGLKPSNFINVAGNINSSGGGSTPPLPYPQGPRLYNTTGALITNGADFNGGGFFTGYWLTTGDPVSGSSSSLSNAIFVGGWYTTAKDFSMTSGTSGVHGAPNPATLGECGEICTNGADDDGDGFIDEYDEECFNIGDCDTPPNQNGIHGAVFFDANANQIFTNGEYPQPDVTVTLFKDNNFNGTIEATDTQLGTQVTNSDGQYNFNVTPSSTPSTYDNRINAACNDGRDGNNGENRLQFGKDKNIGLHFTGINIPAGSVITSAYLHFVAKANQSSSGSVDLYAEKNASPANFCTNSNVTTRIRTTAKAPWPVGGWITGTEYQSVDVKDVLQELVSTYGAYSNGTISMIMISTGANNVEAKSFETNNNSTQAPRLVINYTSMNASQYLLRVETSTLPPLRVLSTSGVLVSNFTAPGVSSCDLNFGFKRRPEVCNNGIDDNGDGLVDCADITCDQYLIVDAGADATLCNGGNTILTAIASSEAPPHTYAWSNALGAGDTKTVNPSSTTTYTVTVTNANGCTATDQVVVTVVGDPSISANPADATICVGGTQTLSVAATGGTPALAYQWKSSLTSGGTYTDVIGATSNSFTTPALSVNTFYRVEVSASGSGCNSVTSGNAEVTVVADPAISSQPAGATICTGGTHTMSVTATGGTPSFNYQWQSSTNAVTWTNVSGATSSSYTTPVLTTTAYYRVVVGAGGSGCGSITSNNATVTVVADPVLTTQPVGATICEGGTHSMSVTTTGGASLIYQWQRSTDNVTFSNIGGATLSTYTTPGLNSTTYYRAIVTGASGCGTLTSNPATVTVVPDPNFTTDPVDATICTGGTNTLNITAAGGTPSLNYQWQSSPSGNNGTWSNINGATTTSYTTPALSTTTYYQMVISATGNGCDAASKKARITIVADPAITTQPANTTICTGGTATFSVTATGGTPSLTYQWQSSLTGSNSSFTNIGGATSSSYTTSVLTATTYYRVVVGAAGSGCGSITSSNASVTVVADPTITTQPLGTTICQDGTHTMSAVAAGGFSLTYQWQRSTNNVSFNDIGGATLGTYTTPSVNSTTYYRAIVTGASGCNLLTTNTATVTVVPDPNITTQPVDMTVCTGSSPTLSVTATGGTPSLTYQWQSSPTGNNPWTNISGATSSNYTTGAMAGPNYFRVVVSASGSDCNSVTSNRSYVDVIANIAISSQPASSSICFGSTQTLNVSTTGGSSPTYQWQVSTDNLAFSNIAGATLISYTTPSLVATRYYRVIVSGSGSGCSSVTSAVATISVGGCIENCTNGIDDDGDGLIDCADSNCSLSLLANAGTDAAVCAGAATTLTATATGGVTPYTLAWSNGLGGGASKVVSPASATTYTVTVTSSNGCTSTDQVSVSVNALPIANAGLDVTICAGLSTTLTASGGTSYAWSNGLGSGASKTVTPASTTTYTVTVTNASGCTATDQVVVNVNASPIASAGSNVTICNGTAVNLTGTASGGITPYSYSWSNGLGAGATKTVTPNATTIYSVTITGANACSSVAQVSVGVNSLPNANAGADATICQGQTAMLSATASGAPAPFTYIWSNGYTGNSQSVTPASTTTYTVSVTSSNGCVGTDQKVVTVQNCTENCNNNQDDDADGLADCADSDCGPSANAGTDLTICSGNTAFLSVGVTGGSPPYSYNWSNGLGTGSNKTVSPLATTTYSVTVTSASGCTTTDQVVVTVTPCSENCTNGLDDDGDGLVDCADPNCAGVTAPVLLPDNYNTCPGMTYSNRVTYNDNNLNNPLYSIATNPTHGTVTIDWTGKFVYVPNGFDCVTDQFAYQVCNQSTGCCATANVTIVLGDNTAPQLINVPADLTINCDDMVPVAPTVTGFDLCPGIFMDFNETSSQNYVGACGSFTITRTWTATDFCGNSFSDDQKIIVVDLTKPELFKVHTTVDGSKMVAGVAQRVNHGWKYVRFPITFKSMPVVLATVTTNGDAIPAVVQLRNVSQQGFDVRLREEEAADGSHGNENVSWVAVEAGLSSTGMKWEAGTLANVDHLGDTVLFRQAYGSSPIFLPTLITNAQSDPATLRLTGLDNQSARLFAQEETSADAEVIRLNETIAYMAIEQGQPLVDAAGDQIGETGKLSLTQAWATVNLANTYTKPVVVVSGISNVEGQPITIRVRNVTSKKFEVRLQEWGYLDGAHTPETVSWMVVEGSVPANQDFYCEGRANSLVPNVNIMALDNCDDLVEFAFNQNSAMESGGLLSNYSWTAIDDCGNTSLLARLDTCLVAAVRVKASVFGAFTNNGNTNLMRDNLRAQAVVPIVEPYSNMPTSYPYVVNSHPKVTICHHPDQVDQEQMEVEAADLQGYLDDGDEVGSCGLPPTTLPPGAAIATYRTKAHGDWMSPNTWAGGIVPSQFSNFSNTTISIEHKVILQNQDLSLKNNAKLYVTNGGLTMTTGFIRLQNSSLYINNSTIDIKNYVYAWSGTCLMEIKDSKLKVGGHFSNESGLRRMENVCVEVAGDFTCGYNNIVDSLKNTTVTIGGIYRNYSNAKTYLDNAKFRLMNGNFVNEVGSTIAGKNVMLLLESGSIINSGIWTAKIDQFCVAGSSNIPLASLPAVEDCTHLTDWFQSCNPDNILQVTGNGGSVNGGTGNGGVINAVNGPVAANEGFILPTMLDVTGSQAIVDWLLLELRDMDNAALIKGYATVLMRRDGSIVSETGDSVIVFRRLLEDDYLVSIRHRNHLGLMTDKPFFLSISSPPLVDFTNTAVPMKGGGSAGRVYNGKRFLWGGDLNGDGKVIYQGPGNDVFRLFARIINEEGNVDNLANYIVPGYEHADLNMDGKVIYQGPNNDRSPLLTNSILAHTGNGSLLANFIVMDFIP